MKVARSFLCLAAIALALPACATGTVLATGSLANKRYGASTAVLADGRIMVAGGKASPTTTSSIEIYDPASGQFVNDAWLSMTEPREAAVAVSLPTGLVLIAGGAERVGTPSSLASAELFDPLTLASASTASLSQRREYPTATLLANGKVLIAGGYDNGDGGGVDGDPGVGALASAELYDPLSGSFSATGAMQDARYHASAVLLADGRVLVIGGFDSNFQTLANCEIYDPGNGQFSPAANLPGPRINATATLLADGKVLVAGGNAGSAYSASALLYDPLGNTWNPTGSMSVARANAGAVLLPDGRVLVAGGQDGQFSAPVRIEAYTPGTGTFATLGDLASRRASPALALLPNGRVLVAGGYIPPPDNNHGGQLVASAELIDLDQPVIASTGNLVNARQDAMASILPDGTVLIAGGRGSGAASALASAEVYLPASNGFVSTGSMGSARLGASAQLLPDGSVLIAGGRNAAGAALASAERYDPQGGAFMPIAQSMRHARSDAASALLPNGFVLLAGGDGGNGAIADAETFDWYGHRFQRTGSLAVARSGGSAVVLGDGSVLIVGGVDAAGNALASSERFEPSSRTFIAAAALATARQHASIQLLPNGKVLVAGGFNASGPLASAELYDPGSDTFTATGSLTTARSRARTVLLSDGRVLVAGGVGQTVGELTSAELYDPGQGRFSDTAALQSPRAHGIAALLADGRVLLAGGESGSGALASAELFAAGANDPGDTSQHPLIQSAPARLALPAALELDGVGLRGSNLLPGGSIAGSEGAGGGTSASTPSNIPLLRLQRVDNGQVLFQSPNPVVPWSDVAFTTPSLSRFDPFDASSRMAGTWRVSVIANGVEGAAKYVSFYWIEDEIFASGFEAE